MRVLLLGSGGREHALFKKLHESTELKSLHVFPGNGGFPPESIVQDSMSLSNIETICNHVKKNSYDLIVVGPEQPLVDGITDLLSGICPVFGPRKAAAQLEGSKQFSKEFMQKYNIPTGQARTFTEFQDAWDYAKNQNPPIVIKADGLAAGKGVTIAMDHKQAKDALTNAMQKEIFGSAGRKILIEDFLPGQEVSVFCLCDGSRALPLLPAQDHKRVYDNDEGPNTGGMGACLPIPFVNDALMKQIQTQILDRAVKGMEMEGCPYRGLLYAGLMVHNHHAKVVEFNVRFGDPETQAVLMLLEEDLLELLFSAATGSLPLRPLHFRKGAAIAVVLAAEGYPGTYKKDIPLQNLDAEKNGITLLHAGTYRKGNGIFSSGGRVLNLAASGDSIEEARRKVYQFLEKNSMDSLFYRKDIGIKVSA